MKPLPRKSTGVAVLSASSVFIFTDLIAIGLRLWSRKFKRKGLDIGDYFIVVALLLAIVDFTLMIIEFKWGQWDIISTAPIVLYHAEAVAFGGCLIWIACVSCTKLSILFAYREFFFCVVWFHRCVYAMIVLCVLFCIGFILGFCLRCTPFELNYKSWTTLDGRCIISAEDIFYLMSGVNLFMDIVLLVMPLPVVWTLRISFLNKLGVSAMFGLGLLIVALVSYRFSLINANKQDVYYIKDLLLNVAFIDGEPAGTFSSIELNLGIISACLPFLAPPIAKLSTAFSGSRIFSNLKSIARRSSKERISDEAPSKQDPPKLMNAQRKQRAKDPYEIPRTIDEEHAIDSTNFVTVPDQWPSEPLLKEPERCR